MSTSNRDVSRQSRHILESRLLLSFNSIGSLFHRSNWHELGW